MDLIEKIFLQNRAWSNEKKADDPDFFNSLVKGQSPDIFWIGCSDSRVPANEITSTHSGQIFVHRNIANMVVNTDMNLMSGLQYAVDELKVKHVIVCGHYGCGGVKAALGNADMGTMNNWIKNIKDVYRLHRSDMEAINHNDDRFKKLVELNVQEQVQNLSRTAIIQNAWKRNYAPVLHGWVYDIADGLLQSLVTIKPGDTIDPIYKFEGGEGTAV